MNVGPELPRIGCRAEVEDCSEMSLFTENAMQDLNSCRELGKEPEQGDYSEAVLRAWDDLVLCLSEGEMNDEEIQEAVAIFRQALVPDFVKNGFCPLTRGYLCGHPSDQGPMPPRSIA